MTPPLCTACGKPVATYQQWFCEHCPAETPQAMGHQVEWLFLAPLPVTLPETEKEATNG